MDRRQVIAGLAAGAAAAALPNVVEGQGPEPAGCGLAPEYFPNLAVLTHTGRRARFYEDLIRDRIVLIHFLSDVAAEHDPVSENLARAQALLGDRMGRDVFFYSIATDAERDTPRRLAELAERHGAGQGWLFLTAEPGDLETLKGRFFIHDAGHSGAHAHMAWGTRPGLRPRPPALWQRGGQPLGLGARSGRSAMDRRAALLGAAEPAGHGL